MTDEAELDALVEQVLELTTPPEGFKPALNQDAILIGFLFRCRVYLKALRTLVREGLDEACDPLARAALELSITGQWLMADPGKNFPLVLGAFRRDWQLLRQDYELHIGVPFPDDSHLGPLVDPGALDMPEPVKLPPLPQRAREVGQLIWYAMYRLTSLRSHGTLLAAAVPELAAEQGVAAEPSSIGRLYLTLASVASLLLAGQASQHFRWDRLARLEELAKTVVAAGTDTPRERIDAMLEAWGQFALEDETDP